MSTSECLKPTWLGMPSMPQVPETKPSVLASDAIGQPVDITAISPEQLKQLEQTNSRLAKYIGQVLLDRAGSSPSPIAGYDSIV